LCILTSLGLPSRLFEPMEKAPHQQKLSDGLFR
jgi:hypothetical protein